jgi:hypothetical protein
MPDSPDFNKIASALLSDLERVPAKAPGSVIDGHAMAANRILAGALREAFEAGGAEALQMNRVAGSLIFTTLPRHTEDNLQRQFTVLADDRQPDDSRTAWAVANMTIGDRSLMRALCAEMVERLDEGERREADRRDGAV